MMPFRPWALAAVILALAAPAVARAEAGLAERVLSQPVQAPPRDCANAATTPDLGRCAVADFRAQDARLNAAYREARGRCQDDAARDLLKQAQRAWLAYRDATCAFEADLYRGGTIASVSAVGCLARVTRERVDYLEHAFEP